MMFEQLSNQYRKYNIFLLVCCLTGIFSSCMEGEEYVDPNFELIDPTLNEMYETTWNPGDSLIFNFSFELVSGNLNIARFVDFEFGRATYSYTYVPEDSENSICFSTFIPESRAELFTARCKIPENIEPSSDKIDYMITLKTYRTKSGEQYTERIYINIGSDDQ